MAGPGDVPVQLNAIYEMAEKYCKSQTIPLHMDGLTRHLLKFSSDAEYPTGQADRIKNIVLKNLLFVGCNLFSSEST